MNDEMLMELVVMARRFREVHDRFIGLVSVESKWGIHLLNDQFMELFGSGFRVEPFDSKDSILTSEKYGHPFFTIMDKEKADEYFKAF